MDGQHFDRVARSLATPAARRRVLWLLAATIVAGWNSHHSWHAATAQRSEDPLGCTQDAECVDGDGDPCTGGACVDGLCTYFIVDCIPGHVCCGNGACCPVEESGGCLADIDCVPVRDDPCGGVRCEAGSCVPFLATCAPDFACCGNGTCCPRNGGCVVDGDCPASASPWGAGARCVSGACVPTATPA